MKNSASGRDMERRLVNPHANSTGNNKRHGVVTRGVVLQGVYAGKEAVESVRGPAPKEGNAWNIDFGVSLDGVKLWARYRDERPREAEWEATERALAAARDLERDEKVVVAVEYVPKYSPPPPTAGRTFPAP